MTDTEKVARMKCPNCRYLTPQKKENVVIGMSCRGDPSGKKWAPAVAMVESRCGEDGKWFKWKDR